MKKKLPYVDFGMYISDLFGTYFKGLNQTEIAKKLGTQQALISKWYTGERLPSETMVDRIYGLIGVNISGQVKDAQKKRGLKLRGYFYDEDTETLSVEKAEPEPTKSYDPNIGVPYFDTTFELGFDELENDQTRNPDYMIDFEPYNKCSAWVNARGDSMAPTISGGDILALKEIKDFRYLINGEIYALTTKNGLRTIKRIRDNGSTFTLIPDNRNYSPQDIDKKEVLCVFQVMGCMKMF